VKEPEVYSDAPAETMKVGQEVMIYLENAGRGPNELEEF
jgi:hypothetical protein